MIAAVLACACLAALAGAAGAAKLSQESMTTFQAQLNGGQVHAVVFHERVHKLHVSLSDGRKVVVVYAAAQQPQLLAQIKAKGVRVKFAKQKAAKKPVHHKLRYIVGGIAIAVIVVVVAVLLVDRRRKLRGAGGAAPAPKPQQ